MAVLACDRNSSGVGTIRFTRGEALNAVNREMNAALKAAVLDLDTDPGVRVISVSADGRAFCAGADMKDADVHSGDSISDYLLGADDGIQALIRCSTPTVAGIQGHCVGAGVEIALACDVVIAADDALFTLPQIRLGIVPGGGGMSRLVQRVGPAWAARIVMLCERTDAVRAAQIGLVSEMVPLKDLAARTDQIALALATMPPVALRQAKEAMADALEVPANAALRFDQLRLFSLLNTDEKKAAQAAFGS